MNIWTAILMGAIVTIAYRERANIWLLILSAYTRLINWRH
jgi:hypothetical protein